MQRFVIVLLSLLILSCSSEQATHTRTNPAVQFSDTQTTVPSGKEIKLFSVRMLNGSKQHISKPKSNTADSINIAADTAYTNGNGSVASDTLNEDMELILQRLEGARQHYLLALASQESGDSVSCGIEFEAAGIQYDRSLPETVGPGGCRLRDASRFPALSPGRHPALGRPGHGGGRAAANRVLSCGSPHVAASPYMRRDSRTAAFIPRRGKKLTAPPRRP